MPRNRTALAASAILGAAIVAAPAVISSSSMAAARGAPARAATAGPAKIQLKRTSLGEVLVDGTGFTVYAFSRDGKGKDRCVTTSGCTGVWPMIRTHGSPRAGHGVKRSLLGTIKIRGGVSQVTYAGHPLYHYSGDVSPGSTDYVGASQFGGVWRAVKSSGALVG
jgi:predicted lipoprotein with Yx(FWY)xxD motif